MMNKSHATQGVCGVTILGTVLVALDVSVTPVIGVLGLSAVLTVAGSTYPDIDSEGSHPTKSFGWISHLLHSLTHLLTQAIYNATLGNRDRKKKGSHRLLTHTAIGNILSGATLVGICYLDPVAAAVAVGFLIGMAVAVWRKRWKWQAWLIGGIAAWAAYDPRWIWIWGIAFAIGNAIHCFGDSCTKSGTPWFWPMERKGKRWGASHALPDTLLIKTGTHNEKILLGVTWLATLVVGSFILYLGSWI